MNKCACYLFKAVMVLFPMKWTFSNEMLKTEITRAARLVEQEFSETPVSYRLLVHTLNNYSILPLLSKVILRSAVNVCCIPNGLTISTAK